MFPQAVMEYVLRPHGHMFYFKMNERVKLEFNSKPDANRRFYFLSVIKKKKPSHLMPMKQTISHNRYHSCSTSEVVVTLKEANLYSKVCF